MTAVVSALPLGLTEAQFSATFKAYALLRGWTVSHQRPALTKLGYRTAIEGHKGAPDWLLARGGQVLLVELKTERGRVAAEQKLWGQAIGPAWYRLYRPSDWPQIVEELA